MTEQTAVQREARVAGLGALDLPSLEQVERRRFELWLVSTALLVGVSLAVAGLSLWSPADLHRLLDHHAVRIGVVVMSLAMSAYLVEKERSLRRLCRLLLDERMLTTALSSRLREISALLEAGRAVNSSLELAEVLDAILRGASELLPAATGSIMLLERNDLLVVAAVGNEAALGARQPIGAGIAGHVARTGEPLLVDGRATASRFPGLVRRAATVQSALCVPLVERGVLLGVLSVGAASDCWFTEYDLRAVSVFAENAATAIAKARLFERSRRDAERLAHRASHDALTGLANRSTLADRVMALLASEAARGALLFLDLDGFKQVNDRLGHVVGDELLLAVAGRIRGAVATRDVAARLGGDEFAVLLDGVGDPQLALAVASRILDALAEPVAVDGELLQVTASIGVAICGIHGRDFVSLLDRADRALYAAKLAGRACCRVYDGTTRIADLPYPRVAADDVVADEVIEKVS